jgi:hypothetical protein
MYGAPYRDAPATCTGLLVRDAVRPARRCVEVNDRDRGPNAFDDGTRARRTSYSADGIHSTARGGHRAAGPTSEPERLPGSVLTGTGRAAP